MLAKFTVKTKGHTDIIDLTGRVQELLQEYDGSDGLVNIFVSGSTVGLTMIENEPGLNKDLPRLLEELVPSDRDYAHNQTWGDGNGYAHLRSSLLPPSLTVPFAAGRLLLGTWQQIVLLDFDNRTREREILVSVVKS